MIPFRSSTSFFLLFHVTLCYWWDFFLAKKVKCKCLLSPFFPSYACFFSSSICSILSCSVSHLPFSLNLCQGLTFTKQDKRVTHFYQKNQHVSGGEVAQLISSLFPSFHATFHGSNYHGTTCRRARLSKWSEDGWSWFSFGNHKLVSPVRGQFSFNKLCHWVQAVLFIFFFFSTGIWQ